MNTDFTETLAIFFHQSDPELQSRIEGQEEALREARCTEPLIGRWIDSVFTSYLFSTFSLKDADFAEMFSQLTHLSAERRQQVMVVIQEHISRCQHCSLKQGYDLEFEARFKKACQQNEDLLLQLLG